MSARKGRIPTEVFDEPWVYARNDHEGYDPYKVGKWMLFLDKVLKIEGNMTPLDVGWTKIEALVRSGGIFSAKSSTNMPGDPATASSYEKNGVLICYTRDYTDAADVKRVADLIRQNFGYNQTMYYKTDVATLTGQYRATTGKRVSIYRHLPNGEMHRSAGKDWVPV